MRRRGTHRAVSSLGVAELRAAATLALPGLAYHLDDDGGVHGALVVPAEEADAGVLAGGRAVLPGALAQLDALRGRAARPRHSLGRVKGDTSQPAMSTETATTNEMILHSKCPNIENFVNFQKYMAFYDLVPCLVPTTRGRIQMFWKRKILKYF